MFYNIFCYFSTCKRLWFQNNVVPLHADFDKIVVIILIYTMLFGTFGVYNRELYSIFI